MVYLSLKLNSDVFFKFKRERNRNFIITSSGNVNHNLSMVLCYLYNGYDVLGSF